MLEKLKQKILNLSVVIFFINLAKKIIIPGFDGMSIYDFIDAIYDAFTRGDISTRAYAIAYNLFMAFFPTIILLVSLIPFIPVENFQENLLHNIAVLLPKEIHTIISSTIEDMVTKKHTAFLTLSFLFTVYYASNTINTLLSAFSKSYQLSLNRNPFKQRVSSFVLMLIITILMLFGFAIIALGEKAFGYILDINFFGNNLVGYLFLLVKWIGVTLIFVVSISILYNVAHLERIKWKTISSGASFSTICIILASVGLKFYFSNFSNYNELYGSISSLIIFMMWLYICATCLIMGFELYAKTNTKH